MKGIVMRNPFTPKITRLQRDLVGQADPAVRSRLLADLATQVETDRLNPNPRGAEVLRAIADAEAGRPLRAHPQVCQALTPYMHLVASQPDASGAERAAVLGRAYDAVERALGDQAAEGSVGIVCYAYERS